MGDLGTIGTKGLLAKSSKVTDIIPFTLRSLVCEGAYMVSAEKETTEGNPQPCIKLHSKGYWRFRWSVAAGTRTIQADCKQALNLTPYPSIKVNANPSIGVNADVVSSAGAGAGWKTIPAASISPSSAGCVWVELHANYDGQFNVYPCYFDNVSAT